MSTWTGERKLTFADSDPVSGLLLPGETYLVASSSTSLALQPFHALVERMNQQSVFGVLQAHASPVISFAARCGADPQTF